MDSNRPGELRLDISDFLCTLSSIKVSRMSLGHDKIMPKVVFDLGPAKLSGEDLQRIYLERFASAVRN